MTWSMLSCFPPHLRQPPLQRQHRLLLLQLSQPRCAQDLKGFGMKHLSPRSGQPSLLMAQKVRLTVAEAQPNNQRKPSRNIRLPGWQFARQSFNRYTHKRLRLRLPDCRESCAANAARWPYPGFHR